MAMAQIMDAMNVIGSIGGDAEFGKMFDQYIQKECETQNSQTEGTNHESADQSQTTEVKPNVAQDNHDQIYSQMHHQQPQQQQQYHNQGYSHQQNNGQSMQSNGGSQNPYNQNQGYNHVPTSQQSYQMQSHYPPHMGNGHLQHYHNQQQHYYAQNGHSGQPNGYMMGPGPNHPNPSYPGQMHPPGNHPRMPMMLPVPSGSPNPNQQHVPTPGIETAQGMNQYGHPGQWPSGGGKIKATPRAPKKRSKKGKDPNEPQKPASAYALFFRERQAMIKGQSPNASFGEISKIVASMWDTLEPEIKSVYKARTEDAKKDYLQALAAYRASGVATGEQASQYASPGGYTYPSDTPVQSNPTVPVVPPVQPAQMSPGIPPNMHTTQQLQETS